MKKISVFLLFLIIGLTLCSCNKTEPFKEGQLLYDCGATNYSDVQKYEFLYEDFQADSKNKPVITEKDDTSVFAHYEYVSDFPVTQMHELFVYPSNHFTITVNEKEYTFFLHEDGSLTSVPDSNEDKAKTYQADEKYRITDEKLTQWIQKYDK